MRGAAPAFHDMSGADRDSRNQRAIAVKKSNQPFGILFRHLQAVMVFRVVRHQFSDSEIGQVHQKPIDRLRIRRIIIF